MVNWSIQHNITQTTTFDLFKIINNCYDLSLSTDARTLLKIKDPNQSAVTLKNILPGKYYHYGICNGIKNYYIIDDQNELKLVIGIDGLPLNKSKKVHLANIMLCQTILKYRILEFIGAIISQVTVIFI